MMPERWRQAEGRSTQATRRAGAVAPVEAGGTSYKACSVGPSGTMRRPIALILLLLTVTFQTEAVFGESRDGDVHHENVAEAWAHAHDPHGSHVHDAPDAETDASTSQDAGDQHEHGGSFDHCTHVHGVAIVALVDMSFVFSDCASGHPDVPVASDTRFEALTPPPRS